MKTNKMINSPITRLGGKSRLRKQIIELLKEHTCYVEVFFGAGWVYFGKEPSKVEVINDIDGELINLFKMIQNHPDEINRILETHVVSREIFTELKQVPAEYMTEIQRAVRYLYLINHSYSGKAATFGYSVMQHPKQKIRSKEFITSIAERMKNTYVENLDFETLIRKYDRPGTLFFLDPPYFETCIDFTKEIDIQFGKDEHLRLRDLCSNMKGNFILTVNDHPWMRELYKDFYILPTEVMYSCNRSNNSTAKELIIASYDLENLKSIK